MLVGMQLCLCLITRHSRTHLGTGSMSLQQRWQVHVLCSVEQIQHNYAASICYSCIELTLWASSLSRHVVHSGQSIHMVCSCQLSFDPLECPQYLTRNLLPE